MCHLYKLLENYSGLLIFEIAGRDYCLDYSLVASTLKPPFEIITGEDPGYSHISYKDTSIPLINLEFLLYQKEAGRKSKDSRVIIVEHNDELYGLLVGKIKEIFALDSKYITTSIKFNPDKNSRFLNDHHKYLTGSLEIENKSLLLLDVDRITEANKISKDHQVF